MNALTPRRRTFPTVVALLSLAILAGPAVGGGGGAPFSNTTVYPGTYDTSGPWAKPLAEGPYGIGEPSVFTIASEVDGEPIQIALVHPVGAAEPLPLVIVATPYLPSFSPTWVQDSASILNGWANVAQVLVPHGYAFALVAIRGTAGSGGCIDEFGPKETADLDQAVTHLATQSWSTGSVGMVGFSYFASAALEVAGTGNPYLKTVVAASPAADYFSWAVHNGVPNSYASVYHGVFYALGFGVLGPGERDPTLFPQATLCTSSVEGTAAFAHAQSTGTRDPGGWFAARSPGAGIAANYKGSLLLTSGFNDTLVPASHAQPWVEEIEAAGVVVKQVRGNFNHAWLDHDGPDVGSQPGPRWDAAEMLLRWMNHWVKGVSSDLGARVQVQDSDGQWRIAASWPPAKSTTSSLSLALGSGGVLTDLGATPGKVVVGADPAQVSAALSSLLGEPVPGSDLPCDACVRFQGPTQVKELRFAGEPTLELTAIPLGPSGTLTARLFVSDGTVERHLTSAVTDLRFASGTGVPAAVVAGQPMPVLLRFAPTDAVVAKGSHLVLELTTGTDWPYVSATTALPVEVQLGPTASQLHLETFRVKAPDLFDAP